MDSQRIVFFGGAGVSTESGIPDFRSADGIFMEETGYQFSPEEVISNSFYKKYPEIFFEFYFDKLVYPEAEPTIGHTWLKELEDIGKDVSIVTQNIDGLHQKAGSHKVYELHGTTLDNYCETCGQHYTNDALHLDEQGIPRCPKDGGIVRPNVVLYEEGLNQATIGQAVDAIRQADMLIIAGTSLVVYPAAGLVQYFGAEHLVIVNKTPLKTQHPHAIHFEDSILNVFQAIDPRELR
ncbi:NAD-dependent protein deacylase [Suicoccus acidiformans]|uniref:protein acetyllysine N-acetyltransferase n=2 Tax=Suicoccus acidiformans TaxID=2036206 RepID=A0A347WLI9_9LACT|nr:NAD-dependent protein deacylase [Suicoccus acidiformans]